MNAEIKRHWERLAAMGCLISGCTPTLHHCHGGSLRQLGIHKGLGQKTSDWLVIPLAARYHVGDLGIDGALGVMEWEHRFGSQVGHLDDVCRELGVNVWKKAGIDREVEGSC